MAIAVQQVYPIAHWPLVLGVEALRKADYCVAVHALDRAHPGAKLQDRNIASFCNGQGYITPDRRVCTQSGALFGVPGEGGCGPTH